MDKPIQHFDMKTIGLSAYRGHKPVSLLTAAKHNYRELLDELVGDGPIDPGRVKDNCTLYGPATASGVQELANELLIEAGIGRLAKNRVQAIEMLFSLPDGAGIDQAAFFDQCLSWLQREAGLPLLTAVVHNDEATPHMHALLLPLKDGEHLGAKPNKVANRNRLEESFFLNVAGPFGLLRGRAKVRGVVKQWVVAVVLARCEAMGLPVAMGPLWADYRASIERDPTGMMHSLGIDVNTIRPGSDGNGSSVDVTRGSSVEGTCRSSVEGTLKSGGKKGPELSKFLPVGTCKNSTTETTSKHHVSTTPTEPATGRAIDTLDELRAAVGCRSLWVTPTKAEQHRRHELVKRETERRARIATAEAERHSTKPERRQRAQAAIQMATDRHTTRTTGNAGAAHHGHQTTRMTDGDLTRERDEYAHDTSAWND